MSTLQGKKALVTGGSRGIGAAIARRLAAEGADVAITYERAADRAARVVADIEALGRRGLAIQADSADPRAVPAAVDEAARSLGGLDILVNNAGIFRAGPIEDLSLADIDATLNINVRAVILASQAAARHMGQGGRIISIGSNLASRVPAPGMSLYSLSKSALIAWTQGLARDLGPRGITVNIVHPGSTNTEMNPANGEHADAQRERMAIPEYGSPDDIAALIAFVAGPQARSINGAGLTVDGGANA
ncbi:SDR family NAD(P)-dependent oxidoreductase [Bordetella pseudohinzii]|uniref:Diacetyl reductase [(S)-acetoin forming] n=1 Tax=Bordetella pseudohinzii TaxID=1331258 RepID=A0A0J6C674_9BORD|nr:SDR family oxidoreductase [Bordetella pseudohinzii]ANY17708.1 oxidoreductase [Bordetella pseudohinzii]KMM24787.1 oxidoreductase [Bordetella pseudohinzii]KXA77953.1 oxidoreductase [Bordetella pseudohinzii]KXA79692.1 oxidoreductase [Bordetella pseudohinzii]CUJ01913.1 Diacetyl reductase [(S)-acetoin forming] [Bordetella pseudohinzii]